MGEMPEKLGRLGLGHRGRLLGRGPFLLYKAMVALGLRCSGSLGEPDSVKGTSPLSNPLPKPGLWGGAFPQVEPLVIPGAGSMWPYLLNSTLNLWAWMVS